MFKVETFLDQPEIDKMIADYQKNIAYAKKQNNEFTDILVESISAEIESLKTEGPQWVFLCGSPKTIEFPTREHAVIYTERPAVQKILARRKHRIVEY